MSRKETAVETWREMDATPKD